jgi:drug/metabolite transporter (DMT)-like permease
MVFTFYAIPNMVVSQLLTITNTFPIWIALLSWPLSGEFPPLRVWLAILLAVAGAALMLLNLNELPTEIRLDAALAALGAALCSAVAMLGLHRLNQIDSRAVVVHFSAVALLVCLTVGFLLPPAIPFAHDLQLPRNISLLLGVGLTASVGQILLTKAFTSGTPAKVSVVGLTQIVFALFIDLFFHDYQPTLLNLFGMSLVLFPSLWLMMTR